MARRGNAPFPFCSLELRGLRHLWKTGITTRVAVGHPSETSLLSMRLIPSLLIAVGILLAALSASPVDASATLGNNCLSYPLSGGRPGTNTTAEGYRNHGTPLSTEERGAVQDAIDALTAIGNCMGSPLSADTPTYLGGPSLAGVLQGLHDDRRICRETNEDLRSGHGQVVAATASRNFPEYRNHPSMTIRSEFLHTRNQDGSLNGVATMTLAIILTHESSHLTNPNNAAQSGQEFETTAYTYEASLLCSIVSSGCVSTIAGSAAEEQEINELLCARIRQANQMLCQAGVSQVDCASCPNSTVTHPCSPFGASAIAGRPWFRSADWVVEGQDRGVAFLDPVQRSLELKMFGRGLGGSIVDLSSLSGKSTVPLSMLQSEPGVFLVGAAVETTGEGSVWMVEFDLATVGLPAVVSPVAAYPGFCWPISLVSHRQIPGMLILLDGMNHRINLLDFNKGSSTTLLSSSLVPALGMATEMTYVDSTVTFDGGLSWEPGVVLWCAASGTLDTCSPAPDDPALGVVFMEGDLQFDDIVYRGNIQ